MTGHVDKGSKIRMLEDKSIGRVHVTVQAGDFGYGFEQANDSEKPEQRRLPPNGSDSALAGIAAFER